MTESASEARSEDEPLTSDWACCCMFGFSCLKVFFKFKKMGHKCHTCFSCFRPTLISWKGTLHIQNIFLVLVDHSEYPKNIHTYIHTEQGPTKPFMSNWCTHFAQKNTTFERRAKRSLKIFSLSPYPLLVHIFLPKKHHFWKEVSLSLYPFPVQTFLPEKTPILERSFLLSPDPLLVHTFLPKKNTILERSFLLSIPLTCAHVLVLFWLPYPSSLGTSQERGRLTNSFGHSFIYCISAINFNISNIVYWVMAKYIF